jgi:transcriptional regulator with XRE-family HTH domain
MEEGFGPFALGEEGYPDAGQVCRFYREQKGLKPINLAHALGITDVAVRGMENNRTGLDSLSLRRRLVSLLEIPPRLMGIDGLHVTPEHYWWISEGYPAFLAGVDEYPCPGQLVKYYREEKKQHDSSWTQAGLGRALNISDVAVRGMENNNDSLDSISRRRALAFILSIPPVLLGLDSQQYTPEIEPERLKKKTVEPWHLEKISMRRFQEMLPFYWNGYYTSKQLDPLKEIAELTHDLRATLFEVRGTQQQHQGLALLSSYYQLASTIARDQCNYPVAFFYANRAVRIARILNSDELLAASLLRRSFISFEQDKFDVALVDLNAACPAAQSARSPLKGLVFQVAGHVHAHMARSVSDQKKALSLLDSAASLAYAGPYTDDEHFIRFSADWHHVERAEAYLALCKPDEALCELDIATRNLAADGQVRRLAHLNIYRAKAYICKNELADATAYALTALDVSKAIQSTIKVSLIVGLYRQLKNSVYGQSPDISRLGVMLRTY